ncbi:MAG: hypothetical protein ACRDRJ_00015 [Streptosporangiaceae bacterium]
MTGNDLEAMLFQHMPEKFIERLLRAVFAAHKVAAEECAANFKPAETENIAGLYRRAKLEGFMRDTAGLHPQVRASVVKSKRSNWNHTELSSGPINLTASSVPQPCDLVEEAEFRSTLARDNQLVLWPEPEDEAPNGAPLYAILLHSKSRSPQSQPQYRHLPGSAYIAFPLPDLSGYAHDIDLFEKFPQVVDSLLPQEWDNEAKVRYLYYTRKAAVA